MYISVFLFEFKIAIPLKEEFFHVIVFKLECCHIYILNIEPHLEYQGNCLVYDKVKPC